MTWVLHKEKPYLKLEPPSHFIKNTKEDKILIEGDDVTFLSNTKGLYSYNQTSKVLKKELSLKGIRSFSLAYQNDKLYCLIDPEGSSGASLWVKTQGTWETFPLPFKIKESFVMRTYKDFIVVVYVDKHLYKIRTSRDMFQTEEILERSSPPVELKAIEVRDNLIYLYSIIEDNKALADHLQIQGETWEYVYIPIEESDFKLEEKVP